MGDDTEINTQSATDVLQEAVNKCQSNQNNQINIKQVIGNSTNYAGVMLNIQKAIATNLNTQEQECVLDYMNENKGKFIDATKIETTSDASILDSIMNNSSTIFIAIGLVVGVIFILILVFLLLRK